MAFRQRQGCASLPSQPATVSIRAIRGYRPAVVAPQRAQHGCGALGGIRARTARQGHGSRRQVTPAPSHRLHPAVVPAVLLRRPSSNTMAKPWTSDHAATTWAACGSPNGDVMTFSRRAPTAAVSTRKTASIASRSPGVSRQAAIIISWIVGVVCGVWDGYRDSEAGSNTPRFKCQ
jgi:hypothetical protein